MKNQSINKLNQILLYENDMFRGFFLFLFFLHIQTDLV